MKRVLVTTLAAATLTLAISASAFAAGPPDGAGPWTTTPVFPEYQGTLVLCPEGFHPVYNTASDTGRCFAD